MDIRKLSPELAKKAEEELGENNERLQSDISTLRCWLENQKHLISRTDDQFLVTFLRRCNFNLEDSKKRIDSFLTLKTTYPDIFKHRSVDSKTLDILKIGLVTIPPNSLPNNGPKLVISHLSKFDAKKHSFKDYVKVRFMLYEIMAFKDDTASISGVELIFDLKNCSLSQVIHLDPVVMRKAKMYEDQSLPLRFKTIHIINMKKELQSIVQFVTSFGTSSKSPIQVLIHEKESDLYNYIPQEAMPIEYGGNNGSEETFLKEWENILNDHREYFENDALLGTNEELRKESKSSLKNIFGLKGSFKKLEID